MKPDDLVDRDVEWEQLERFVNTPGDGVRVAVVSGRRRVGKSYLLRRLAADGLYHQALIEERQPAIARFVSHAASRLGVEPSVLQVDDWAAALDLVLPDVPAPDPYVVVIDELPYLLRHSPELLSTLQRWVDERVPGRPIRLVLCGSSLSVMSTLLTGQEALRGRVMVDLRLDAFDFRQMREYWAIENPTVAFDVHAVVGGSPGYRSLVMSVPQTRDEFEQWLGDTVLNPAHALYREDEYLLSEEQTITDRGLYWSILAAIAAGDTTPTAIGRRVGRDRTALSAILKTLVEGGFVHRDVDLGNQRGVTYSVADPILRFGRLIVAPNRPQLDERRWRNVWAATTDRWTAQIRGPHAESIARSWARRYADREIFGEPQRIGRLAVADRANRSKLELDLVGERRDGSFAYLGEVKSGTRPVGIDELHRLERARTLLAERAADATLLVVSFGGFDQELAVAASGRSDVSLVDINDLYGLR